MRSIQAASLAILLAAGLAIPASAQPVMGMTHSGPAAAQAGTEGHNARGVYKMNHMHHQEFGHHNMAMLAMSARHPKGTVAFYRAELAITAAQEPQWAAFATVLGDAIVAMHAANVQMATAAVPATVPERMDATVASLTAALGTAQALADTGKALYAVLTPEQRLLADGFWTHHQSAPMP